MKDKLKLETVDQESMAALTIEELVEEIRHRRNMIKMMVGQLYPSIIYSEILKIEVHIHERQAT